MQTQITHASWLLFLLEDQLQQILYDKTAKVSEISYVQ